MFLGDLVEWTGNEMRKYTLTQLYIKSYIMIALGDVCTSAHSAANQTDAHS